ncbi:MAG: aspartate/glutamate racemase family protein [Candidatus Eremiobacteraeota bacterium]|nr:aspartate/glutamate racemase family protein [Candidatus Eremiobacteraeota bacterium]
MSKLHPSNSSQHLGLIGGLGTAAGIFYYEKLVERHSPLHLTLAHADLPTMLGALEAQDWDTMAAYLLSLIESLRLGGATVAAITAVTPHIVIDRVVAGSRIPLVSVLDALPKAIQTARLQRVAVFGTRATVESRIFGRVPTENFFELDPTDSEAVYRIYADVARGALTQAYRDEICGIAGRAIARGANAIILAGTDLSALFRDQEPDFAFLDAARVHIAAIVERLEAPHL